MCKNTVYKLSATLLFLMLNISFQTVGMHNAFSPSTSFTFFFLFFGGGHLQDFVRNVLKKSVRIVGLVLGCVVG